MTPRPSGAPLSSLSPTWALFFIYFFILETKGVSSEEMAKLFGDTDNTVFAADIHVYHTTHELFVDQYEGVGEARKVLVESGVPASARRGLKGRRSVGGVAA
jgi:hypothetical protein